MHKNMITLQRYQHGAATLITSLVLLVTMTIITIFAARSAVMEQRIYSNEYRTKQAFEAADAGLEYGLAYAVSLGGADKDGDGVLDTFTPGASLSNGTTYDITFTDVSAALDQTRVLVKATGYSDDRSAIQKVSKIVGLVPAFPNVPGNPMTTKGTVVINGSADVVNPEGNATIWSGSNSLSFTGAGTTQIPDPSNPSTTIVSSQSGALGVDVILGDTNLSSMSGDQFFENFMGTDKSTFENGISVRSVQGADVNNSWTHPSNPGTDLARKEIIWVDGNASYSGNTTIGCTTTVTGSATCPSANTKPVVMVIDGNLLGNGTVKVYGVVYITGDFSGSGNLEVTGAVIMEGGVTGTGSLSVMYDSAVIEKARTTTGAAAALAGSWRDFNN